MTKPILKSPTIDMPSKEQLDMVNQPYSDEELSTDGLDERIEKLMKFFDLHGIKYDRFKPERFSYTDKKAYPNYDQYMYVPGEHDTNKWLLAVKNIYYKQSGGLPYKEAIRSATNGWKKMEIHDFLNWVRFYEEGAHMKYKFADVWYENGEPGYFLHSKTEKQESDTIIDENAVNDSREKKILVEKQRQKIIGRLDSAEKLLRSQEGQEFAGAELENLMEAIYSLKKKVQLVNKISTSIRLYEDMIVREANVLSRKGFQKAADTLYSLADNPPPSVTPPNDPSGAGNPGTPGTLPASAVSPNAQTSVDKDQNKEQPPPNAIKTPPAPMPEPEKPKSVGINEFIKKMNEGNNTEESATDDNLEVTDQLDVEDSEQPLMVTEAQAMPPGPPPAALEEVPMTTDPAPAPLNPAPVLGPEDLARPTPKGKSSKIDKTEEPLEVTENDIPSNDIAPMNSQFNDKMDQLMQNVTIADVVADLEDISKTYKTREQPRRLALVDMKLDSLGLASMFPSLSEAQNKALEANNYISTRVDDILSKLRGAMANQESGVGPAPADRPDVSVVKNKLQSDQDKEAKRKQMRKEQENSELDTPKKETPQVEIGEDLGGTSTPVPAPAAIRPPAPKPLG